LRGAPERDFSAGGAGVDEAEVARVVGAVLRLLPARGPHHCDCAGHFQVIEKPMAESRASRGAREGPLPVAISKGAPVEMTNTVTILGS
jgi:hypothetical protein